MISVQNSEIEILVLISISMQLKQVQLISTEKQMLCFLSKDLSKFLAFFSDALMVLELESRALNLMKYMQVPIWKACHCELRGSYTSAEACFLDKYLQFLHDECKISSFHQ